MAQPPAATAAGAGAASSSGHQRTWPDCFTKPQHTAAAPAAAVPALLQANPPAPQHGIVSGALSGIMSSALSGQEWAAGLTAHNAAGLIHSRQRLLELTAHSEPQSPSSPTRSPHTNSPLLRIGRAGAPAQSVSLAAATAAAESGRCSPSLSLAGPAGSSVGGSVSPSAVLKACPGLEALLRGMPVKHYHRHQQQQLCHTV